MPTACYCLNCGINITDPNFRVVVIQEEYPEIEIGPYCEQCYGKLKICSGCQKPYLSEQVTHTGNGEHYCSNCISDWSECFFCGTKVPDNTLVEVDEGKKVCSKCRVTHYDTCGCCSAVVPKDSFIDPKGVEGLRRAGIFRKYGKKVCYKCFETKKKHFKLYEIEQCINCGSPYSYTVGQENPKHYCGYCWSLFKTCNHCGTKDHSVKRVNYFNEEGKEVSLYSCKSCKDRKYQICSICKGLTSSIVSHRTKGSLKETKCCVRCSKKSPCSNCGTYEIETFEGLCWNCHNLYKKNTCKCGRCKDHNGSCRICDKTKIYSYSTKPKPFFNYKKDRDDNIFFGFENETCYNSDSASFKALNVIYDYHDPKVLLCKSDGSITGPGFEIVSQPMTLEFFNSLYLDCLFNEGLTRSSSCGLHIHVGRNAFVSEVHLYKVINFLHNNEKFTRHIAGRNFNSYAAKLSRKPSSHVKEAKRGNTERRSMVNLTNSSTVEFRLFAGCVTPEELRSKVEVLHALIVFQKENTIIDSSSVELFINFLKKNVKQYPHAYSLVESYGM